MKKLLLLALMMALIGVGIGLYIALKLQQPYKASEPEWETSMRMMVDPKSVFGDKNILYVLILGTDYNYTNRDIMFTKGSRSDTMMLARLNLDDKRLKILSIPRDTRIKLPGDGYDRINSAFAIGGPKLSAVVVQNITGIPVDFYVRIKEEGLKSLVDAIGGIDVDVEKNMNYEDHWGHLHIHLKKGLQHLNGEGAAEYSRFRHDEEGDYGRIRRQQQVIKAIQKQMMNPLILTKLEAIVKVARENVETDLKFPQLLALGNLFKGTSVKDVETQTFPTTPKDYQEGGVWVSYVEIQEDEAKKVLDTFVSDPIVSSTSSGSPLRVEILNGSGISGKAQEVAERLKSAGFVITRVANADRFDYTETQVVDHTGKGEGDVVAKSLQVGTTLSVPQETRQVDVTVIVGRDK